MIYVVATTQMKPDGREAFIKGHKACIAETHKEKGCIAYEGHVSVNDLSVGRNPREVLRILDALQTDELCPCNWQAGEKTLQAA